MDDIPRSILILFLILLGGSFAGSETALSYCNRLRMKKHAEEGDRGSERVVYILDRFDKALSTILIGTNVCYVFASTFAAILFIRRLGTAGAVVSTVLMTLLIFFFAETIPKNIARANADAYALICAVPVKLLMILLTPVSALLAGIGWVVKRLLPREKEQPTITEDEFTTIIDNIQEEGLMEPEETRLIKSAVEFSDKTAGEIMTPLKDMVAVSITEEPEKLKELILREKYSRLPVYAGSPDRIVGILQTKDYLQLLLKKKEPDISSLMKLTYDVPPEIKLDELFEGLGRRRTHMAIVIDVSGSALGFVTMEEILEELVGEIYDEDDASDKKEVGA
jgi:CBS domain containing-hemolysin-like protein